MRALRNFAGRSEYQCIRKCVSGTHYQNRTWPERKGLTDWQIALKDSRSSAKVIISEARLACEHPNSTAAVAQLMLTKPFLRRLVRDGCRMQLLAAGLNVEIRRYLKGNDDGDETDATARQLDLWQARHRTMVEDIDRARVFVPSRGKFVPLEPDALTPEEAKEAGEYLIAKGQYCVCIGRRLVALAEMGWRPQHEAGLQPAQDPSPGGSVVPSESPAA